MPTYPKPKRHACLVITTTFLTTLALRSPPAFGLAEEKVGPDGFVGLSPDWPKGTGPILLHRTRVYLLWVNGNETAYFHADANAVQQLVALFSEMQIETHQMIIRPGSPVIRTFRKTNIPYNVCLELPSGIYLRHAEANPNTGLYTTLPRFTLYVDKTLAKNLDTLDIPPNVSLSAHPSDPHLLIQTLTSHENPQFRSRAAAALGRLDNPKPAVRKALTDARYDFDPAVQQAADNALRQLEKPPDGQTRLLSQTVIRFIKKHHRTRKAQSQPIFAP
jgi:hypothetical protein